MVKKVFLCGIAGTGMSALAGLFKELGYAVYGSDNRFYPPVDRLLKDLDVTLFEGFAAKNIPATVDICVIGNAISRGNPELLRHVSGRELLEGIREFGLAQFGPMTLPVFEAWGIHRGEDFGEIVFNLVDHGFLNKTKQDSRNDFQGAYDFHDAFRKPFLPSHKLS